jgi:hypothetical protein
LKAEMTNTVAGELGAQETAWGERFLQAPGLLQENKEPRRGERGIRLSPLQGSFVALAIRGFASLTPGDMSAAPSGLKGFASLTLGYVSAAPSGLGGFASQTPAYFCPPDGVVTGIKG